MGFSLTPRDCKFLCPSRAGLHYSPFRERIPFPPSVPRSFPSVPAACPCIHRNYHPTSVTPRFSTTHNGAITFHQSNRWGRALPTTMPPWNVRIALHKVASIGLERPKGCSVGFGRGNKRCVVRCKKSQHRRISTSCPSCPPAKGLLIAVFGEHVASSSISAKVSWHTRCVVPHLWCFVRRKLYGNSLFMGGGMFNTRCWVVKMPHSDALGFTPSPSPPPVGL